MLQRTVPQAEICFIERGYHFFPDQASRVMDFLERRFHWRDVDVCSPSKIVLGTQLIL
jgi:hypothetical protein